MALSRAQMDARMDEHFGYEQADDVVGVLATLTPDCEHDIVGSPTGPTVGPEGARGFYEALFADLADGRIATGRAPGRPFGLEGRDRPLSFRLLHVVEYADDGRMKRENVWIDLAAILQQLPQ